METKLRSLKSTTAAYNELYEHIVDESYIFLVRPYQSKGNLIEFMVDSKMNLLTELEIGKRAM